MPCRPLAVGSPVNLQTFEKFKGHSPRTICAPMRSAAARAARISTPERVPSAADTRSACADSTARSSIAVFPPSLALR